MAFFTSIFRNLKNGGEVKSGFFYNLSKNPEMMKLIEKANNQPKPIAKKEGGVVEKMTPFHQAIRDTFLKAAGGGGIHRNIIPPKAPIAKKKGGRVKKSKTKKQKK